MPGEEQETERFEDYLALDRYLEELEVGKTPRLPETLTPAQARIYRMAALFRSASSEAAAPRLEFAAELEARLLREQQLSPSTPATPLPRPHRERARQSRLLSRRGLLVGGTAAAAASFAAGVGIDRMIEAASNAAPAANSQSSSWNEALVPEDAPARWLFVTTVAELGNQVVRFTSDSIVGYVLRADSASGADTTNWKSQNHPAQPGQEQIIALSAACTHMGCIVQWQNNDHKFHCPCHGGMFEADGSADPVSSKLYLRPLPQLETKIEQGNIYVRVPMKA
jgi:Rieske Fe-S protein